MVSVLPTTVPTQHGVTSSILFGLDAYLYANDIDRDANDTWRLNPLIYSLTEKYTCTITGHDPTVWTSGLSSNNFSTLVPFPEAKIPIDIGIPMF